MNEDFELQRREADAQSQLPETLPLLLRRLYAQRGIRQSDELERGAKFLHPWQSLHGIEQATALIHQALIEGNRIMVVGDFDADGATSTALTVLALRQMGARDIDYLVPNRFDDGYGLIPAVVEQVAARGAKLIITVDNGISSHAGVELAHASGIKVVITDHHLPGDTLPDADAIVNPNLKQCQFPSRALAGVGVAFYLMLALRARLRECGVTTLPNLAELLDLVALGTVADVVPLDTNNRILVWQGLSRIRAGKCRPGIRALLEVANRPVGQLSASDLGFALGPRLNAAGRLDDMSVGVALLLSDNPVQARQLASELDALNQMRKEIEQGMQQEALRLCQQFDQQRETLPVGLAIWHPEWHQGVVGILASRLKDRFHRPVIAFAPAGDGLLKGSGRSVPGLHLKDVLERIDTCHPGMIDKFGGHAMAAGLTLATDNFDAFREQFALQVAQWLTEESLRGIILSDGPLPAQELILPTAELLREAGPWGQAFPEPLFDGRFTLLQQKRVGERHLKMMVEPEGGGPLLDAIAFNVDTARWPDPSIRKATLAYRLDVNEFRGNRSLQLIVEHIWPV
ncbi:MAG: Single-stranded-DNA-specific exonuclease RecJ [Candidatus Erwinia impunctatus]